MFRNDHAHHPADPQENVRQAYITVRKGLLSDPEILLSIFTSRLASDRWLKQLAEEFLHGGHATALMAPAVLLAFGIMKGDPVNLSMLAITYLIPLIVYSFDYYRELDGDRQTNPERTFYLANKKKIYPALVGTYIVLLAALIFFERQALLLCLVIGIMIAAGVAYPLFLKRLTRIIPGFKNCYVAAEWALASVLIYVLYSGKGLETASIVILLISFLNSMFSTIFFDLKDIESDKREGLKTIPVLLGWDRSITFLLLLDLATVVPLLAGIVTGELSETGLALLIFLIYSLHCLKNASGSGAQGMAASNYLMLDFQYLLWPVAIGICSVAADAIGVIPMTVLLALFSAFIARSLFFSPKDAREWADKRDARGTGLHTLCP